MPTQKPEKKKNILSFHAEEETGKFWFLRKNKQKYKSCELFRALSTPRTLGANRCYKTSSFDRFPRRFSRLIQLTSNYYISTSTFQSNRFDEILIQFAYRWGRASFLQLLFLVVRVFARSAIFVCFVWHARRRQLINVLAREIRNRASPIFDRLRGNGFI